MILARLFAIGGTMNVQKEEYIAAVLLSTGMQIKTNIRSDVLTDTGIDIARR